MLITHPIPGGLYRLIMQRKGTSAISTVFGFMWRGSISSPCSEYISALDQRPWSFSYNRDANGPDPLGPRVCLDTKEVITVIDSTICGDGNSCICFKVWHQNSFAFFIIGNADHCLVEVTEAELEAGNLRFPRFPIDDGRWGYYPSP